MDTLQERPGFGADLRQLAFGCQGGPQLLGASRASYLKHHEGIKQLLHRRCYPPDDMVEPQGVQ